MHPLKPAYVDYNAFLLIYKYRYRF